MRSQKRLQRVSADDCYYTTNTSSTRRSPWWEQSCSQCLGRPTCQTESAAEAAHSSHPPSLTAGPWQPAAADTCPHPHQIHSTAAHLHTDCPAWTSTLLINSCLCPKDKIKLDGKYSKRVQIPTKSFLSPTLGNTCGPLVSNFLMEPFCKQSPFFVNNGRFTEFFDRYFHIPPPMVTKHELGLPFPPRNLRIKFCANPSTIF